MRVGADPSGACTESPCLRGRPAGHGLAQPFDYAAVDMLELARRFLREVLDALGLRTANIAANSMGGLWSVAFAIDAPDRVSRLALVGAPLGVNLSLPLPFRALIYGRRATAYRTAAGPADDVGSDRRRQPEVLGATWRRASRAPRRRSARRGSGECAPKRRQLPQLAGALRQGRNVRCQASRDPGRALAVPAGADDLPVGRTRPFFGGPERRRGYRCAEPEPPRYPVPDAGTSCGSTTPTVWWERSSGSCRRTRRASEPMTGAAPIPRDLRQAKHGTTSM